MTGTGSHADTRDMHMVHTTFRREFGALIHALDEHMRLEEQRILPLAAKYITAAV
jgi:hypothetical protein